MSTESTSGAVTSEGRINPHYPARVAGVVDDLDGKVVLVTGASGPVGRELVPLLVASGATVITTSRNGDRLEELRQRTRDRLCDLTAAHPSFDGRPTELSTEFGKVYAEGRIHEQLHSRAIDLTDQAATIAMVEESLQRFGRLDAVIHLVGGWAAGGVIGFDPAKLRTLMENQVVAIANVTTAVMDPLVASGGHFLSVGSYAAEHPEADNALYGSVKAACDAWVTALASAFNGTEASATTVMINAVLTGSFAAKHPDRDFTGWTPDHVLARKLASLTTQRFLNGIHVMGAQPTHPSRRIS